MGVIVHEFQRAGSCSNWHDGDTLTATSAAVTCPACRARHLDADACPSRSKGDGRRCVRKRGHGGLHHHEEKGVMRAWTDEDSPELAWELHRRE